jgi:hypothetical protein
LHRKQALGLGLEIQGEFPVTPCQLQLDPRAVWPMALLVLRLFGVHQSNIALDLGSKRALRAALHCSYTAVE